MGLYLRKVDPKPIKAIQFLGWNFDQLTHEFGEIGIIRNSYGELIIRTAQGQKVAVGAGEWVTPDVIEGTFYPIADDAFKDRFEEYKVD